MLMLKQRFTGFNVTLPHKEAILPFCDVVDPVAQAIGAVNTVTIEDGQAVGTNTDAFGFMENLREQFPAFDPVVPVLVLGAGGAARAAIYALLQAGVSDVIVCNRNEVRAATLARAPFCSGQVRTVPWEKRSALAPAVGLIVNTTSLGMTGQDALEIDLSAAQKQTGVYDIVYRPLITPLLQQAQEAGLPVISGLGMLLQQARPAFHRWFGVMPEIDSALVSQMEHAAS
jgi:shikimate dehydrogenase